MDALCKLLDDTAERLGAPAPDPLDVSALCQQMGVRLVRERGSSGHPVLMSTGREWLIHLPCRNGAESPFTPFERFQIAHELGHYVLARSQTPAPLGRSEYWQHEALCDRFAVLLLVSARIVSSLVASRDGHTVENVTRAAVAARVPWTTAAFRVSYADPDVAFLCLRRGPNTSRRWIVRQSTIPNKKELGRRLDNDGQLSRVLSQLPQRRSVHLAPALLQELPSLHRTTRAVAMADGDVVRLGLRLSSGQRTDV